MADFDEIFGEPELKPEVSKHPPGTCEYCGGTEGLKLECSRTAYDTSRLDKPTRLERIADRDDPPEDPNRDKLLCRECAAEHHEFWNDQWNEFYRSQR